MNLLTEGVFFKEGNETLLPVFIDCIQGSKQAMKRDINV